MNTVILAAIGALVACGAFCIILYQHRKIKLLKKTNKELSTDLKNGIQADAEHMYYFKEVRDKSIARAKMLRKIWSQKTFDLENYEDSMAELGLKFVGKKRYVKRNIL